MHNCIKMVLNPSLCFVFAFRHHRLVQPKYCICISIYSFMSRTTDSVKMFVTMSSFANFAFLTLLIVTVVYISWSDLLSSLPRSQLTNKVVPAWSYPWMKMFCIDEELWQIRMCAKTRPRLCLIFWSTFTGQSHIYSPNFHCTRGTTLKRSFNQLVSESLQCSTMATVIPLEVIMSGRAFTFLTFMKTFCTNTQYASPEWSVPVPSCF